MNVSTNVSGSKIRVRAALVTTVVVVSALVQSAPRASAVVTCPDLTATDQDYSVPFGTTLRVAEPGLLAGDIGTGLLVETSWETTPPDFPSDDVSSVGNAAIRYGTPGGSRNRLGGFTYTPDPDPGDPFSGVDGFNFSVIDKCGNEAFPTATVTVVPVVVDSAYTTAPDTPLSVPAATGFLAHDRGVDPASMFYDLTSAAGGSIDDDFASDGSFVYTPPPGFVGTDTFGYQVNDLTGDNTYTGTVTIKVGSASVPDAPSDVRAVAGDRSARVSWSVPAAHGSPITSYIVTASPGGATSTVAGSQTGASIALADGSYTFKVRARNVLGLGPSSAASNAVTISTAAAPARVGYWMLSASGKVFGFGDAAKFAAHASSGVAIAPRRDGKGYWTVDAAGNVSQFGAAANHGGNPPLRAGEVVSTISATPSGNGYWLFTNRGRAFAYGDAHFKGDLSGTVLNGPIVASVATPTGNGYYMVGSDGGVFSFGDARFHGSTGGIHLNKPIVGISPTANNAGYWLVASDGGVFAFNAPFRGSMGGAKLSKPVNGLVGYGNGYLMVASDGGVFDFSNKSFLGSLAANPPASPIIGIAAFSS